VVDEAVGERVRGGRLEKEEQATGFVVTGLPPAKGRKPAKKPPRDDARRTKRLEAETRLREAREALAEAEREVKVRRRELDAAEREVETRRAAVERAERDLERAR
jgi:Tfp pilus assembly protein FimV